MNTFQLSRYLLLFSILFFSCDSNKDSEIVDNSVSKLFLTKVEIVDGTIYLHWTPPSKQNFNKATLFIEGSFGPNVFDLSKEDINKGLFNDSFSVNKKLTYRIELENEYESRSSNILTLQTEDIIIEEELIGYELLKVTYSRHPMYNNFDHYEYKIYPNILGDLNPNGGEIIVEKDIVFADKQNLKRYEHWLRPMSIENKMVGNQITKSFEIGKLFDTKDCNELLFHPPKDIFIGLQRVSRTNATEPYDIFIHELKKEDLSIINTVQLPTEIDYVSDIIIDPKTGNLLLDSRTKTYMLDINDYSVISTWDSSEYSSSSIVWETKYRNGLIILRTSQIEIYLADSKNLIYSGEYNGYFNISDDGKYLYNNNELYEVTVNGTEFIVSTDVDLPYYVMSVDFLETEDKCIYTSPYSKPTIFDFKTKSKEVIESLDNIRFVYWDDMTNRITLGEYHVFYNQFADQSFVTVYNPTEKKGIKLHVYDDHYNRFYKYMYDKLVYSGGQYLENYF